QLRRLCEVHRGRLPGRPAARSTDGRPARSAPDRAREGLGPRQPGQRLQLQAEAAPAARPPAALGGLREDADLLARLQGSSMEEETMKASRHTRFVKWMALVGVGAAVAATSAQAGQPPADPGWDGLPHCTVPSIEGMQLSSARKSLHKALCGTM